MAIISEEVVGGSNLAEDHLDDAPTNRGKSGGKREVKTEVETEVMHRGYGGDLERGKGGGMAREGRRYGMGMAEVRARESGGAEVGYR